MHELMTTQSCADVEGLSAQILKGNGKEIRGTQMSPAAAGEQVLAAKRAPQTCGLQFEEETS